MSDNFIFFGDEDMEIAEKYMGMLAGRGHKVKCNDKHRKTFPKYFKELKKEYGEGKLGNHIHERSQSRKRKRKAGEMFV